MMGQRTPLMKLTNQGLAAIDAGFLNGTTERLPDDPAFATRIDNEVVDLAAVSFECDKPGPQYDPEAAVTLHRKLGIRRGVATDSKMWAWLATRHAADFLRRRWATGERTVNRNRFVGRLVDNGLSRLWWAAELTFNPGMGPKAHRQAVGQLLLSQYRTDRLLSMGLVRHPPVLLGVLDAIGDDQRWQVLNELCKRLGLLATTYAIDTMSREEAEQFVRRLYKDVVNGRDFSLEDEPGG